MDDCSKYNSCNDDFVAVSTLDVIVQLSVPYITLHFFLPGYCLIANIVNLFQVVKLKVAIILTIL